MMLNFKIRLRLLTTLLLVSLADSIYSSTQDFFQVKINKASIMLDQ